jgi:hypothetical protein
LLEEFENEIIKQVKITDLNNIVKNYNEIKEF